jgi:3-octaprenyl-4-hydroxybenzoate carboxy-lyase
MSTARRRAVEQDWHEKLGIGAGELARRIADVLYSGKPGINTPKTLLVESDIDITDLSEVVWAFATRAHPEHGEFRFPGLPSDQPAIYLDEEEAHLPCREGHPQLPAGRPVRGRPAPGQGQPGERLAG